MQIHKMKKRVFIIHGWGGSPIKDWMEWLAKQTPKEVHVFVLAMPNTDEPVIEAWINHLKTQVGDFDENTYFVGHSIGCQTILRYLETQKTSCGGVLLVAPWFHLLEGADDIAKPWLETPMNFNVIKKNMKKCVCIFSDDDPYVPISDAALFEKRLDCTIIIEKNKLHYNETEEPTLLPHYFQLFK